MNEAVNLFDITGPIQDGDVVEDQGFEYLVRVVDEQIHQGTGLPQLGITVIALNPEGTESKTWAMRTCGFSQIEVFDTVYELIGDVALHVGRSGRDRLHGLTVIEHA